MIKMILAEKMKKNTLKILIAIVVLCESIVFLTAGVVLDTLWLIILGGVFLGLYVVLGEFYLFKIIRQTHREKLEQNEGDFKQTENDMVDAVNSTYGMENYVNIRAHQLANISHSRAVATLPERIWLVILMTLVLSGFISVICLACLGYMFACATVFGAQVLLVCGTILIAKRLEKLSPATDDIDESAPPQKGKVVACSLHSQSTLSLGSASRIEAESGYQIESRMTTRILDTVYKMKIDLNGKSVIAFSREFYNAGDEVTVRQKKKKRFYVVVG